MKRWQIALLVVLAALGGGFWYGALDGAAPARAEGEFDIAAYRALVASDASETLPTEVRIEFIGENRAPSFAAEAGAFDGERIFSFPAFQVLAPGGAVIIDAALDQATIDAMSKGKGGFNADAYARLLAAMSNASRILITHEHLDHVMAIARHPEPASIASHLRLTSPQLAAMPQHAINGALAAEIAATQPIDLSNPTRVAPGIVAQAAPGHSPGSIVIYVKTTAREYLFIGDIAWQYSSIAHARGRPRFITWMMGGVDPDRPAVLRQIRALHDLALAEPELVIATAHDAAQLHDLAAQGAFVEGFETASQSAASPPTP